MELKQKHEVIQWRKALPGLSDQRQLPEVGREGGWQDGRSWVAGLRGGLSLEQSQWGGWRR